MWSVINLRVESYFDIVEVVEPIYMHISVLCSFPEQGIVYYFEYVIVTLFSMGYAAS